MLLAKLSLIVTSFRSRFLATSFVWLLLLAGISCGSARADVGVVLNDSLDTSVARITGSGHSAVYLSRICPESPVKLRLCQPGEQGSVISNYTTLGEDQPFEWNIVPLSVYLYGVEDPENRPVYGSEKIKRALQERYREKYISAFCQGSRCRTNNGSEWREMVGAALSRSIYIFVVDTSVEQDMELIARFNALPNENHFNPVLKNCADFTRSIVNTYFPHAARPDYINDFGMTSPKAIARSFTRYAVHHPESNFRVIHVAQLPGTIKQSSEPRTGTEQLFRSKKLLVPMILFGLHELPIVTASYELTGRFNPESAFEKHPSAQVTNDELGIQVAKKQGDLELVHQLESARDEQIADIVGTPTEWKDTRKRFNDLLGVAVHEEILPERGDLKEYLKRIDGMGTPFVDSRGSLWLEMSDGVKSSKVGISLSNLLATGSDKQLATGLLLAHIGIVLKNSKHSRETFPELNEDWSILVQARSDGTLTDARLADPWVTKIHMTSPERLFSWVSHRLS